MPKEKEVLVWELWASTLTFRDSTFRLKVYLQKALIIECLQELNRRQFVQQNNSHKKEGSVLMDKALELGMHIFLLWPLTLVVLSSVVILVLVLSLIGLMLSPKKLRVALVYLRMSIWKTVCKISTWIHHARRGIGLTNTGLLWHRPR